MRLFLLLPFVLAGCAASPQQMAAQSNWDVCRFTMGGPHAAVAEQEARNRGLDCGPLYPAISARMQQQNQAVQNYINTINPPAQPMRTPLNCRTVRIGTSTETQCY